MTRYKPLYEETLRELERVQGIVDLKGIARHMKVNRLTPQQWRQRGLLPAVDFPEIDYPLWYVSTIKAWAATSPHRVWYDEPDAEPMTEEPEPEPDAITALLGTIPDAA